jgi:hypothetical protein
LISSRQRVFCFPYFRSALGVCDTTLPPLIAISDAQAASRLPWCAFSAFCCTVLVSSSIDEAVSSSALACCSVRADRSFAHLDVADTGIGDLRDNALPLFALEPVFRTTLACAIGEAANRQ